MKRFFTLLVTACIIFAFSSCSNQESVTQHSHDSSKTETPDTDISKSDTNENIEPVKKVVPLEKMFSSSEIENGVFYYYDEYGRQYSSNDTSLTLALSYFEDDEIIDISMLSNFTNLTRLELYFGNIDDISPIKNLKQLKGVELTTCNINDISALSDLTKISYLNLRNNSISDISPLKNLTKIRTLDLSENNISDISVLNNLVDLNFLYLNDNNITTIPSFKTLSIYSLDLSHNKIVDISSLGNLLSLENLDLAYNNIADISPLKNFVDESHGMLNLDLSYNDFTDISPLSNLTRQSNLRLHGNEIKNISSLSGCYRLYIYLDADFSDRSGVRELQDNNSNIHVSFK